MNPTSSPSFLSMHNDMPLWFLGRTACLCIPNSRSPIFVLRRVFHSRRLTSRPLKHLSSLLQAIGLVQGVLQELKDSKNLLSAYIEAHEAVIASIRRIHDDILIEIFKHSLPPLTRPFHVP